MLSVPGHTSLKHGHPFKYIFVQTKGDALLGRSRKGVGHQFLSPRKGVGYVILNYT